MHYSEMIEQQLQAAARAAVYQTKGHAATAPGLRGHSIGEQYPYTVIAIGNPHTAPVRYAVMDLRTGNVGRECRTYQAALIDLAGIRVRNLVND